MGTIRSLGFLVASLWLGIPATAEEKPADDYARAEIRGKLTEWTYNPVAKDRYAVVVEQKGATVSYLLEFPDVASRKAAKEILGQTVVVSGDLRISVEGDGKRFQHEVTVVLVKVKSIKKVEPTKQ